MSNTYVLGLTGTYNYWLVALSLVIAIIASYTALDLTSRISALRLTQRGNHWLVAGALSMGTGIWAMHFVGMLAFSPPIRLSYDISITVCSLVIAVLTSGFALYLVSGDALSRHKLILGGLCMGIGIATMHYIGMASMRMQPSITYDLRYFSLSLLIAVVASVAAMWLAIRLRTETAVTAFWKKSGSAVFMGLAIAGMHYTGMTAAHFAPDSVCGVTSQSFDNMLMAGTIGVFAILFLGVTLVISALDSEGHTSRFGLALPSIASIVPMLLLALLLTFYEYHRHSVGLMNDTIAKARSLTASVDSDLASVESALHALATSPSLVSGNMAAFHTQASNVLPKLNVNNIYLIDRMGQQHINTIQSFGKPLPRLDIKALHQQVFVKGRTGISDLMLGPLTNTPLVTVVVPVRRGDTVVYALGATINPHHLSRILSRQFLPSNWVVAVFDSTGSFIARTHGIERWLGKKGAPALLAEVARTREGSLETDTIDGVRVVGAFNKSSISNWTVAIGIPKDSLTAGLRRSIWLLLGYTVIFISISLYLAWVLGDRIATAIHSLIKPALALGRNEAVVVPPLYLKELDKVGRALEHASGVLRQTQHDANHDALTGLANRTLFRELVQQQLGISERTGAPFAVLFIDLDGFKAVNDLHGHAVGDELLRAVAARIKSNVRKADVVARLGGDEFAIALVNQNEEGAASISEKLVESLSIPFPIGSVAAEISASIGIAIYPKSGETIEDLLKQADQAMYEAKMGGKRGYVFALQGTVKLPRGAGAR